MTLSKYCYFFSWRVGCELRQLVAYVRGNTRFLVRFGRTTSRQSLGFVSRSTILDLFPSIRKIVIQARRDFLCWHGFGKCGRAGAAPLDRRTPPRNDGTARQILKQRSIPYWYDTSCHERRGVYFAIRLGRSSATIFEFDHHNHKNTPTYVLL